MEIAKHKYNKKVTECRIEHFRLPSYFLNPVKYDDLTGLSHNQILTVLNWFEMKMSDRIDFKFLYCFEPYYSSYNEVDGEGFNEVISFTFKSVAITYEKPFTNVLFYIYEKTSFQDEYVFCIFRDTLHTANNDFYYDSFCLDDYHSKIRLSFLDKCRPATAEEYDTLIHHMVSIGYKLNIFPF